VELEKQTCVGESEQKPSDSSSKKLPSLSSDLANHLGGGSVVRAWD